jgi:hypothetical protein
VTDSGTQGHTDLHQLQCTQGHTDLQQLQCTQGHTDLHQLQYHLESLTVDSEYLPVSKHSVKVFGSVFLCRLADMFV